jgi:hypothetical protein
MRKLYWFAGLGVFFVVYLLIGIPALDSITQNNGVLVSFPIFLGIYAIFAYLLGAMVGHGPIAVVLFIFGYLLADIAAPPLLVSIAGAIPTLASAQLASDVFFFTIFTSIGIGVTASWWLTYLAVPMLCAGIIILELKGRVLSRYLPKMML